MSDPHVRAYVGDLAEHVPHVEPPLVAVLAAGRAAVVRRRRRLGAGLVVVSAAAVLAMLVGPGVVAHQAPADVVRVPVAVPTPSATPDLDEQLGAPPGTRLVGTNGVVIAVPRSWISARDLGCTEVDVPSYVLAEPGGSSGRRCPNDRFHDEPADHVVIRPYYCRYLDRVCRTSPQRLVLGDVAFEVRIDASNPDRADLLATMRASLRILPPGYATVPLWPTETVTTGPGRTSTGLVSRAAYEDVLERAGLGDVVQVTNDGLDSVQPSQGTVVRVPSS